MNQQSRTTIRHTALWGGVFALMLLSGCRLGGERSVSEENDRLRNQASENERQMAALKGEVAELKAKLAETSAAREKLPPDVLDALPRVTDVLISSLSGFDPGTGKSSKIVVWFSTEDGRGRFVQAVGTVDVEALLLPQGVGAVSNPPSERLAATTLSPTQVRDAYRSSFTGTHYTVELNLDKPIEVAGQTLLVRVALHDALTGQVVKAERVISPRPVQATPSAKAD